MTQSEKMIVEMLKALDTPAVAGVIKAIETGTYLKGSRKGRRTVEVYPGDLEKLMHWRAA